MRRAILPPIVALLFSIIPAYADILITNDDMILNGKILEEKADSVTFGNNHGIFNIDRKQIKEIIRTDTFQENVKILREKGKTVDENDVKANFQSGLEKLGNKGDQREFPPRYQLGLSPFFNFHLGKLKNVLPYGLGCSITGEHSLEQFGFAKAIFLSDARLGITYFLSEKGERKISDIRLSAGPVWEFPVSIGFFHFNYDISLEIGIGWYVINGIYEGETAVKWNVLLTTGPIFTVSSILLSPHLRFDYIYDTAAPLYGIGLGIGAGSKF